jgi:tetratricopeptide (TPR) repeat protein
MRVLQPGASTGPTTRAWLRPIFAKQRRSPSWAGGRNASPATTPVPEKQSLVLRANILTVCLLWCLGLLDFRDPASVKLRNQAEEKMKENDALAYQDPALAEQAKNEGNEFFKSEHWGDAIRCYSEAIKRNPGNAVYYSNRAVTYIKAKQINKTNQQKQTNNLFFFAFRFASTLLLFKMQTSALRWIRPLSRFDTLLLFFFWFLIFCSKRDG